MERTLRTVYAAGVLFIAENDELGETDHATVSQQLSVVALAEAFNVYPTIVARDVLTARREDIRVFRTFITLPPQRKN